MRRHTGWKVFGIVVLGLFLFVVVTWIWAAMAADRRLMNLIHVIQRKTDEQQALDGRRPVLRGEAQPGNSWDDYAKAFVELKADKGAESAWQLLNPNSKIDPAVGERALEKHKGALEELPRGAARDSAHIADWKQNFGPFNSLNSLTRLKSRALLREGKIKECFELLLDLCQFGRDTAATGPMIWESIGSLYMRGAWDELHDALASGKAARAELDELDRGLAVLDQSYPSHGPALEREFLSNAQEMIPVCESGIAWGRLMGIGSMEHQMEWMERAKRAEEKGWTEVQKLAGEIENEGERSWNPLVKISGQTFLKNADHPRSARARLRLLRIETHWRATGEILDLEDPFGGRLKHVVKDGALKAWSVGPDGADDGGDGTWSKVGKDIVLEITR